MLIDRALTARRVREEAAALAQSRPHPEHQANGDEQRYAAAHYPMNFTKGLEHDAVTGLVPDPQHFEAFRNAIDAGWIEPFTTHVPVPRDEPRRQWEAPTAGTAYDLEGPDAQAVTMPPAPKMCSDELTFEMAEVYELALLRDTPFLAFDQGGGPGSGKLNQSLTRLNDLKYASDGFPGRPRKTGDGGDITRQTAFRGSSPGVEIGPYLSQFMVLGNVNPSGTNSVTDGEISYGALCVSQKVLTAAAGDDYMMRWDDWLRVQRGYDVKAGGSGQSLNGDKRFIYTPRDLATFVHFDALYEAYLNACLILLGMGTPFDPAFAKLSGMRPIYNTALGVGGVDCNAGGFALYGGPHILTLVTEVATRALKAVRFQKFNNHLRLRPEALAARIEKAAEIDAAYPSTCGAFTKMADEIDPTVAEIRAFNQAAPNGGDDTALLPMAFAEGSPMHPSYGAGHATVAGACVTILKAYFDTGTTLQDINGRVGFFRDSGNGDPVQYEVIDTGDTLDQRAADCPLTLEGELNKLAANISIGRNMAGVHFFTDYYDSLRMGEAIAIGILQEQALCYPTDEFVLSVPTFDGGLVRIGRK